MRLRLSLLALAATLAAGSAAAGEVNTFERIERAPLPGERAAAAGAAYGATLPDSALGFAGSGEETGPSLQVQVGPGSDGSIYGRSSRRIDQMLGDGVLVYENPFAGSAYGYNPRTGYYDRWNGSLSYNRAFLSHLYDGNIAGAPSVSAPLDFWSGRR